MLKTLAEAIGLVILVMFLFLQNWRSTIIPAITIPVSLIGTFAFVKLFGFSINTLTLFGIVLATGIVVDDAIVVIENIERHMREFGKSGARRRRCDAMREVFSAVVVIGIVLVAVFVPVAFFPGTTGRMYQQFSMTIAFAVVLSVFNAVTFTPALSALLLEKESHTHGRFFTGVNRVIDGGTNLYVRVVRGALRWKWAMLLRVRRRRWAPPGWSTARCPASFVPDEDEGYFITIVQAPSGASLEYTDEHHEAGRSDLHEAAGDRRRCSRWRASASAARRSNSGLMFARLKAFEERRAPEHSLDAVLDRLRGQTVRHSGRARHPGRAAGDSGAVGVRRVSVRGARPDRRRHQRTWRTVTQQVAGAGNRVGTRRRPVLQLHGERPAASSSRSIATARAAWACRSAR